MTAPDRIWAWTGRDNVQRWARVSPHNSTIEYVRADLARPTPLAEALAVVKAWAMENFVSDGCKLMEARSPGCLSCDTLHFIEAMEDELTDAALRSIGEGRADG